MAKELSGKRIAFMVANEGVEQEFAAGDHPRVDQGATARATSP
jgi:hypothetical protein